MDFSLPTAVLGAMLGSALLTAALLYLRSTPAATAGLGWWASAFAANTLRLAFLLATPLLGDGAATFLVESLQAVAAILLLAGAATFLGRHARPEIIVAACLSVTGWAAFVVFFHHRAELWLLPLYVLAGGAMIATGILFLRTEPDAEHSGHVTTGLAFVLWGIHKLDYPILSTVEWFAPWGFMLAQVFATAAALGLIIVALRRLQWLGDADRKELDRQKALFEAVFRDVPDAMVLTNAEREIILCNPAVSRVFGYRPEEMAGRTTAVLYESHEAYERQGHLRRTRTAEERLVPHEVFYCRKDGEVFPADTVGTPIHDPDGNLLGYIGVIRDITARKRAEAALREKTGLVELLHKVAVSANESECPETAFVRCLDAVCAYTGWPVGHVYMVRPGAEDRLVSAGVWHLKDPLRFEAFRSLTSQTVFTRGAGLPGRVLATAVPLWIEDVGRDPNFPRRLQACQAGIKAAFAFPILAGTEVVAVLEFFAAEATPPDESLLRTLTHIGAQLGRVVERERAGEILRSRETGLSMAQRIASLGSWEWDIAGGRVTWSDELHRILGIEPGTVVPSFHAFLLRVHPDDRHRVGAAAGRALRERRSFDVAHRVIAADGAVKWVRDEAEVTHGPDGSPVRMHGIVQDITEQRHAEESLRQLSQAVEQSPVSVVITDTAGVIDYVNPKFVEVSGYGRSEVIGRTPAFLRSGHTSPAQYAELWDTIKSGRVWSGEFHNRRKNGDLFWEHATIAPIRDPDGVIRHFLAVKEDITLRKGYEARLLHHAHYDGLTDLPNRTLAMDRLAQAVARARREGLHVALAFVDLDNLKKINDSRGHSAGDRVVVEAGKRLLRAVRAGDTVGRLGGDQFLIVLPDLKAPVLAEVVARKAIDLCSRPFLVDGGEVFVTARVGLTVCPGDGLDPAVLLRNAHAAATRSKEKGGNTYTFFTTTMDEEAQRHLHIETRLRQALARGEFSLAFQPLVMARNGTLVGAEALLRWNNPDLGSVAPDRFIPLAEETGLIVPIGEWVLHAACHQARAWRAAGHADFRVAVNLSPRQCRGTRIVEQITKVLAETGLPPNALEVEITENLLIDKTSTAASAIDGLKALGVRLSIDDFGTGYSSLSYLKRFPFDTLKIDRAFVRNVTEDAGDATLVTAIVAMAHGLGLEIIAEGVETVEQLDFARSHGCHMVQGFYFGRPMTPDAFTAWAEAAKTAASVKENGG